MFNKINNNKINKFHHKELILEIKALRRASKSPFKGMYLLQFLPKEEWALMLILI